MTRITGKTVNADLDQDVITFQIAGVEKGRITSSSTSLGGFTVGSSYLFGTSILRSGLTDGVGVYYQFTTGSSSGSDLAIDGGDSSKINVLTTGWYSVFVAVNLGCTSIGPLLYASFSLDLNATGPWVPTDWGGSTDGLVTLQLAAPAFPLTAGDVLRFPTSAQVSGDTWVIGADTNALQIVRLA